MPETWKQYKKRRNTAYGPWYLPSGEFMVGVLLLAIFILLCLFG